MFFRRLLFKLMELGLGLRPYFGLQTKNPIFVNFRLSDAEAAAVQASLPAGFALQSIRFSSSDTEPHSWVSYNFYELGYPRPEMAAIRKIRCEVNTFVCDPEGRLGVFVFCGAPFVSREQTPSTFGRVADFAEKLVIFLYGCGRLTAVRYELGRAIRATLDEPEASLTLDVLAEGSPDRLSDDYQRYNDISFFNSGKSHDLVHVNSAFTLASIMRVDPASITGTGKTLFFDRAPDEVLLHRGEIGYLVSALHGPTS